MFSLLKKYRKLEKSKKKHHIVIASIQFLESLRVSCDNSFNFNEYRDEHLRSVLLKLTMESEEINSAWESVARHIPNESLKDILQKQFMKKCIDLRARAFVKTYIQIVKRFNNRSNAQKLSKKAKLAFRKTMT